MMWPVVTYFAGHWQLVIATVVAVIALNAAAFFLRNWQAAVLAGFIAVAGFLYQGAVTEGIKEQMAKDSAARVSLLESHIAAIDADNKSEAARSLDDQQTIAKLEEQVSAIPKNDASCLDADSALRLHNIK